ncbi:FMN-binding protein [Actinacidiphila sp. bgisy145]|uniref:FMN-binding protein n=1 Tax=Actinacidiphila sp. bgisy145 TaxID=3413792 RepID=UPI003EBF0B9F
MRRIALSVAVTVGGVLLLLSLKPHSTAVAVAGTPSGGAAAPAPAPSASATAPATSPATSPATGGSTASRSVTGDTIQTRYGPVQLRITVKGGKITAVTAVQMPTNNPRDEEITGFAVPQLTQEALSAQSARIDTVSGATYTSEGYIQSLQSALDKAGL